MSDRPRLACANAELAVECARAAEELGLAVDPVVVDDPIEDAAARLVAGDRAAAVTVEPPAREALERLADAGRAGGATAFLCALGEREGWPAEAMLTYAGDLGLVAVDEVRPLVSSLAADAIGVPLGHAAARGLSSADQARLAGVLRPGAGGAGRLVPLDGGLVGWQAEPDGPAIALGEARDLVHALAALQSRVTDPPEPHAAIPGLDLDAVRDVLLGPPRSLSDPASKAALASYGLPTPAEELCSSPSRAAAEAGRMGFPVRMALASPDLRVWDHPDLEVAGVESAARARETFRQLMTLARSRAPEARLLGVTVTASSAPRALLRLVARPARGDRVHATLGFADPHGLASRDETRTLLPAGPATVERLLSRLAGAGLLLEGTSAQRADVIGHLTDVLLRVAAFVNDHRREVREVELRPLAFLVGGGVEVREARVEVGDAFVRALEPTGATP